MKRLAFAALAAGMLAPSALADGLKPASVLIYPYHRSDNIGKSAFTIVNVTNVNKTPATSSSSSSGSLGGSTSLHFEYVNLLENVDKDKKHFPVECTISNRVELLTPADTLTLLTSCHNPAADQRGYLVVTAEDPEQFGVAWSHNYLIGSETIVLSNNVIANLNAIPFESLQEDGAETDLDGDGQLDFDGVEYEGIPDTLYMDSFFAGTIPGLILINMTGGTQFTTNVAMNIWNDNEFPLSATVQFKCYLEDELTNLSLVFDPFYLHYNTPNDPNEVDLDCDGKGDELLETGWAEIRGVVNNSQVESIQAPAILGARSASYFGIGANRLWESRELRLNGDFMKFGADDPEN